MLCILKVIERLLNLLMLIVSLQFAGSRATFTSTVRYIYSGWGVKFIVLCYLCRSAKLNIGCELVGDLSQGECLPLLFKLH